MYCECFECTATKRVCVKVDSLRRFVSRFVVVKKTICSHVPRTHFASYSQGATLSKLLGTSFDSTPRFKHMPINRRKLAPPTLYPKGRIAVQTAPSTAQCSRWQAVGNLFCPMFTIQHFPSFKNLRCVPASPQIRKLRQITKMGIQSDKVPLDNEMSLVSKAKRPKQPDCRRLGEFPKQYCFCPLIVRPVVSGDVEHFEVLETSRTKLCQHFFSSFVKPLNYHPRYQSPLLRRPWFDVEEVEAILPEPLRRRTIAVVRYDSEVRVCNFANIRSGDGQCNLCIWSDRPAHPYP